MVVMNPETGDLLYYGHRHTDGMTGKPRPVLVVSSPSFNKGEDFICVPLTSQTRHGQKYAFELVDSLKYGLQFRSTVKWTKPFVVSRSLVIKKIGRVPDDVVKEIQSMIRQIFS